MVNRNTPISYKAAHDRVRRLWGSASQYRCVTCNESAQQWAYDDPDFLIGHGGTRSFTTGELIPMTYSQWPEFYMSMCRSCHKRKDLAARGGRINNCGRRNRGGPTWKTMRKSA